MRYMIKNSLNSWVLLFLSVVLGYGQEQGNFFIRNYLPQEIHASAWNELIFQDKRGVIYVGNGAGAVLEYDGVNWRTIPVNQYLFRLGMSVCIKADSAGRIYVGSSGEFGFLEPDLQGRMVFRSLMKNINDEDAGFTDIFNIEILGTDVYFRSIERLFRLRNGKVTAFRNPYGWFGEIFSFRNQLYVTIDYKGIILRLEGDSLVKVLEDKQFINTRFSYSADYSPTKKLIGNDKGLFLFGMESAHGNGKCRLERFPTESDNDLIGSPTRVNPIGKNSFGIGSWNAGIVIINNIGKTMYKINTHTGLNSSHINHIYQDNHQSLWTTTDKGISRIDISQPFSFWNSFSGEPDIVVNVLRYNGQIYYDSMLKGLYSLTNKQAEFIGESLFVPTQYREPNAQAKTHLLVFSQNALYEVLNNKPLRRISFPRHFYHFNVVISKLHPDRIFIGGTDGLYLLRFNQGKWLWEGNIGEIQNNVQFFTEDPQGNLWLILNNKRGIIRLIPEDHDNKGFHSEIKYKKQLFNPPELASATWIRSFLFKDRLLFGTDKGLWSFHETSQRFLPDSSLGKRFCDGLGVYVLQEGPNGEIFVAGKHHQSGNTGVCLPQADGSYKWYTEPFNYLSSKLGISNAFIEPNGTIWLATIEGLIKYDRQLDMGKPVRFKTLIREVRTDHDSILFYGTYLQEVPGNDGLIKIKVASLEQPGFMKPVLTYRFNSIKFSFAAVSFIREDQNRYQYMLEGFDLDWSDWTSANTKEYTNLPEGRYVFRVKARNVFDTVSDEAQYAFTILPPWYRTILAYSGFTLAAILLVYFIVRFSIRRLKASNLQLEKTVKERTREITLKNALLEEQNEEILTINETLNHQKEKLKTALDNLCAAQAQLVESEKMAALGGLVAGVAHEINTPVGIGVTAASSLQEEIQKMAALYKNDEINRKDFQEFLESVDCAALLIQKNLERTASLIQSFKQVSVDQTSEQQRVFNLKSYLEDIIRSLSPKFKEKEISFHIRCDESLELNSFPGAYAQIFTNLLLNSFTHGFNEKPKGTITIQVTQNDNLLKIDYHDDGAGISKNDLPHIFEPFFTTDQRRGTGLGLNILYNLIKQKLHGSVSCISTPGEGARFIIELPVKMKIQTHGKE